MFEEALRPVWAEINVSNLEKNIINIKKKIGDAELIGVIKADAYGHGAVRTAQILKKHDCKTFAIAAIHEAMTLRNAGIYDDIIILSLVPEIYADKVVELNLTPVVCSYESAKALNDAAKSQGKIIKAFVVVDTGMGRIGYLADKPEFAIKEIKKMQNLDSFKIKGLFSHMATADEEDESYSKEQETKFNNFYKALTDAGINIEYRTLANSASIMKYPSIHFDGCRPGIILYGLYPSEEVDRSLVKLYPAMSVKASIVHLKDVPAGFSVSYGRKFTTSRPSKIATIGLGYADGLPRPYSSKANVIVNGVVAPIVGNICMDQCMIDVTDVPNVKKGDEVIVMGSDGKNSITADDIAKATGTINYEITCAFGQRLPKVYIEDK